MVHTPRLARDRQRACRAAEAAQVQGASAIGAALVQISAAFDEAAAINGFKLRVERSIRLGPEHPAIRARFGARAAMLGCRDLGAAIIAVEGWWRDERKAFQIASALGCATRLSLDVLGELRFILRFMRFKKMEAQYEIIAATLRDELFRTAAE